MTGQGTAGWSAWLGRALLVLATVVAVTLLGPGESGTAADPVSSPAAALPAAHGGAGPAAGALASVYGKGSTGTPARPATPTAAGFHQEHDGQGDAALHREGGQEDRSDRGGGDHSTAGQPAGGAGSTHDLPFARIFLVLIAILVLGKLFGEGAERIGQPAVLGELLAGVVLGGSVLGVIPEAGTAVGDIVQVFAEVGVAILLFEIGLETDLKEMFRVGPSATLVALVGIFLPFLMGFLYWYYVQPDIGTNPPGISFWIVAIFVGATLTATSVGITARVLSDLGQMHTSEARIIIGAAVIDDVLGIVILAVVQGLAEGATPSVLGVGQILLFAVGFLVLAVWIGNKAAPVLFDLVDRMRVRGVLLVSAFCFALLLAALADLAGSAMIIGAFAAGIVLSSTNQFDTVVQRIEPVADLFTPIFFVAVGAPVNVQLFIPGTPDFDLSVLGVGLLLTVIAIVGKIFSGYAARRDDLNRLAVGIGMVPRGEVGLIFAAIGLATGILSNEVYSAILIMVILSTFLVPPVLKWIFAREPRAEVAVESAGAAGGAAVHGAAEEGLPGVTQEPEEAGAEEAASGGGGRDPGEPDDPGG